MTAIPLPATGKEKSHLLCQRSFAFSVNQEHFQGGGGGRRTPSTMFCSALRNRPFYASLGRIKRHSQQLKHSVLLIHNSVSD